jgi:hypothetical protein
MDVKDFIEFAYTNKSYLRIKETYLEKIERFKLTNDLNSNQIEKFSSKVFLQILVYLKV